MIGKRHIIGSCVAGLALVASAKAGPACTAVDGDHIAGRDLATADARWAALEPGRDFGFSPEPGAKRVFWPSELQQIARRNAIAVDEPLVQLCFERRTRAIPAEEIAAAVRSWAPAEARITVLEQSKFPAPAGSLTMPRPATWRTAADGAGILHGYVSYGADHRFPVWARIRVQVERRVAVAVGAIPAGAEISRGQVRMEQRLTGLEALDLAADAAQIAGRITVRRLSDGNAIPLAALLQPKQVNSGAIVHVEVRDGATHLSLEGRAENGGRIGDMIMVRNPSSGKAFQARVTGEDAVLVIPRGMRTREIDAQESTRDDEAGK